MADLHAYRLLPSVEELLVSAEKSEAPGLREQLAEHARRAVEELREAIGRGELDAAAVSERATPERVLARARELMARARGSGVQVCVNATGVVLHTGLGRAPAHPEVAAAMAAAAGHYCTVEVDRWTGQRNRRDDRVSEQLARLTGAEAGIAVNNCAGAVVLALATFARGRETVLSRGELVEIGGSFRMPDVMREAGTRLVEVGTTNRTRIGDYEAAVGPETGLLLKVHTSNYRVRGFTEDVDPAALAELGRARGVPTVHDLGSGLLEASGATPLAELGDEPRVREVVAGGLDVVTFSGDKLLGGPQAGLLVGTRERIGQLRANPFYRALRLDKVGLTGLERTLELLQDGRSDELPARALLLRDAQSLKAEAQRLAGELAALEGLSAQVVPARSQPGSGSAPDTFLDTHAVRVTHANLSAEELGARLRAGEPPVLARIQEGALLLDPRTLLPGDAEHLIEAFRLRVNVN